MRKCRAKGDRFYRVQPRGRKLIGHTSESSGGALPRGFVFAYTSPEALLAGHGESWPEGRTKLHALEVVEFTGEGEHDPGDVEGVAVKPKCIVRRTPVVAWLKGLKASALVTPESRKLGYDEEWAQEWIDRARDIVEAAAK